MPTITITVDLTSGPTVPATIYGQGLLSRAATENFVTKTTPINGTQTYAQMVIESGARSFRWPGAGHDTIPVHHWDNLNTYHGKKRDEPFKTDPSTLKDINCAPILDGDGHVQYEDFSNIYDPCYDGNEGPRHEVVTLEAFVDLLIKAGPSPQVGTAPLLVLTWRSPDLWRWKNGVKTYYKDPDPRRVIDGAPDTSNPNDPGLTNARRTQFNENRLLLKTYYDLAGSPAPSAMANPVVQISDENWAGWVLGQEPWNDTDLFPNGKDKHEWIAETLLLHLENLRSFSNNGDPDDPTHKTYPARLAVQFRESWDSGFQIPVEEPQFGFLQGNFDTLVSTVGTS